MKNRLDQDFTLGGLLRFALPTTIMMLVTSLYTIVDGVLTSRLVGENALAAINIAYPAISIVLAVGIMLGTGGSAVVSHRMGTGDLEGARHTFGFLAVTAVCAGVFFALLAAFGAEPLARLLGASDLLLADTACYLRILLLFTPMAMLQLLFESFFVAAGKPGLGLGLTIAAGVTNGVLDWLYMGPLQMGIAGAAVGILAAALVLAPVIVGVFSPAGTQVNALALEGFHLFAPTFLFAGINIFASALFTALSDGRTSALISFARTFGFLMAGLLLLPRIIGVTGVWIAVPVAEAVSCLLSIGFLWYYRAKFGYGAIPA